MNKYAYIIIGHTGQFEDNETWLVEGHYSKKVAKERVDFLNALVGDLSDEVENNIENRERIIDIVRNHPLGDPQFRLEFPGVFYEFSSVKIIE